MSHDWQTTEGGDAYSPVWKCTKCLKNHYNDPYFGLRDLPPPEGCAGSWQQRQLNEEDQHFKDNGGFVPLTTELQDQLKRIQSKPPLEEDRPPTRRTTFKE